VSLSEAAQALGVSIITIRRRIKRGELRGRRLSTPQGFE
jgi:excisionase family DNA binding protein